MRVTAVSLTLALWACTLPSDPPDDPDDACPTPGPGTVHDETQLATDATWRAADSPHVLPHGLSLVDGARLTLEPCVRVQLGPEARIEVGLPDGWEQGTLVARGEARRPVTFEAAGPSPWSALVVHGPSRAELSHVRLSGGGADPFLDGATLVGLGEGTLPPSEVLEVHDVEVVDSVGMGVTLNRSARFAPGSTGLTIADAGEAPLLVGLHGLDGIPEGSYAGNGLDAIVVVEDMPDGRPGLQVDTTVRDLGVDYRIGTHRGDQLRVGANEGTPATLTVESGVVMRFMPGGALRTVSDVDGARGTLVVHGSALAPVRFAPLKDTDSPGAWSGLFFEGPVANHDVTGARIERAGGDCWCWLASCSPVSGFDAAVIIDGVPAEVFLRDSVIAGSAGHGIVRSWVDHEDLDFLAENQVEDVEDCPQTTPELSQEVCPDATHACEP